MLCEYNAPSYWGYTCPKEGFTRLAYTVALIRPLTASHEYFPSEEYFQQTKVFYSPRESFHFSVAC